MFNHFFSSRRIVFGLLFVLSSMVGIFGFARPSAATYYCLSAYREKSEAVCTTQLFEYKCADESLDPEKQFIKAYSEMQLCEDQKNSVLSSGFCLYGDQCLAGFTESEKCIDKPRFPTLKDCLEKNNQATEDEKIYTEIAKDLKPPRTAIRIPGLLFSKTDGSLDADGAAPVPWLGEYLIAIYKYALAVGSIVAVIMVIRYGIMIAISGGGDMKSEGLQKIGEVIIGLCILWGSFTILNTVNPDLTNFKFLKITYIKEKPIFVDEADEPARDGSADAQTGNQNVPYFAQWEGPWAKMKPGDKGWPLPESQVGRTDCTTIQRRGCGSTSLAMVLAFYGESVTPLDTGKWGLGCTGAWQPSTLKNGWPWKNLTGKVIKKGEILGLLKQGKPIVFNCAPCNGLNKDGLPGKTYQGHYVVLTGYINDKTIGVNDPGSNKNKRIMTMTPEQVLESFNTAVYVDKK